MEAHLATVWEAISDAVGDRVALVHGHRRWAWRTFEERAARLAAVFIAHGVGAGSPVGLMLHNIPEVLEAYFAALKIRAVPFNINFRYQAEEVAYLLHDAGAAALVYDASCSGAVAQAVRLSTDIKVLIEVGAEAPQVPSALRYDAAIQAATPAARIDRRPDDVAITYTGGTTGMPKGVVSNIGPGLENALRMVPPMLGHPPLDSPDALPAFAAAREPARDWMIALPAAPLIHSTGLSLGALPALTMGGTVVLLEPRSFDASKLWDTVATEHVNTLTIVGDPFARPMVAALRGVTHDLGSLRLLLSSGAMLSDEIKRRLLEHLPQLTILDFIAATEGMMGMSVTTAHWVAATGNFNPADGVIVITEEGERVTPGSGRIGMVAVPGGEGYLNEPAGSDKAFRRIDNRPYTFPGDFATVEADGSLTLLGRGATCINTAGEKVFPEEVEEILKSHPAVADALVVGIEHERFGQQVAAVISLSPGMAPAVEEILTAARRRLASYKLPTAVAVVHEVPRTAVGKPDYSAARTLLHADMSG